MRLWRRFIKFVSLAIVTFGLAIALVNCTGQSETSTGTSPAATGSASGTSALVFASSGPPVNLEPGNITDGNSLYVQQQIYDRLIDFKPGSTDLVPALADKWEVSDDNLTWTFTLKEGVKFHDGTDFNAEAVAFNFNRWWDPEFEYGYRDAGKLYEIWTNLFGGTKGSKESLVQSVTVKSPTAIDIKLKQPFAAFPAAVAAGYFGIASPTAIQKSAADYGTPSGAAVGTGPYVFEEWRSGERVSLKANPDYWREGVPKEQQLIITFVEDPAARLAQLRAGTVDFTVDLTPDQLAEIEGDSSLKAVYRPSFNVGYLALNPGYEPLSKPEVRRAIAEAINKPEIVKAFWGELGQTDAHFVPPSMENFRSKDVTDYQYNPDAAKQALAAAGYPNGFDLQLWYMPVSRPYFPNPKPIAEAFAAELNTIGIRVSLQTKDWGAYLEDRNTPPGFQSFMLGWTGDYGDPDNFLYAHFGPGSTDDLGKWKNQQVFDLLDQARAEADTAKRGQMYAQVDKILFDEALRIPIVHSQPLLAQRSSLGNWNPSPLGSESFEEIEKS
ncbi:MULTISPECIES: ABC transporter substrate-binding protein [unclassified Leptolyngbya]|uniref:ABC transporter substrate-binding protein n=1 Tax=unclassified Leptolyngbya TaxID=2650499 RepID=UPI001688BDCD|nr:MULTISPECIES: ABC transporter substrate-binding protein [unclassified Leptolyngbya]MBD1914043.1 ABC transporter substrate-binding protein [Leptolyngbya sp. FACHB-8]MBD2154002.1 ABC transporter substrate-binding protein [Leptolyngbya sp. FACHB-16]